MDANDAAKSHQLTREARRIMLDGEPERAAAYLQEAIKLDPTASEPHLKLADALFMLQKFDQSITECNTALKLKPDQRRTLDIIYRRGCSYGGKNNFKLAFQDLNKVIALDPGRNAAYRARAIAFRRSGNNKAAIVDFQKFLANANKKDDIPATELACAQCYRDIGDRVHERVELTKVIALSPDSIEAYRLRGDSLYKDSKFAQAASDFAHALELEPENEHCRNMLKSANTKARQR
jgi:tetratricopeptide (TPR) repeat protein